MRSVQDIGEGNVYQGQWDDKLNVPWGRGIQISADGSRYDGFWRYGVQSGYGRLVDAEGLIYEGEWQDNKANGYGVYKHYNGNTYEG